MRANESGTLVDSEPLGCRALLDLLPSLDESVLELTERYRGKKLAAILLDLERRCKIAIPAGFEPVYREHAARVFEQELKPVPGALEMLRGLNHPRCIASSGPPAKIIHSLKITGLEQFFGSRLFSAYEIESWKPDPGLFLHAAREMGFATEQCIVIEDSPTGVAAAKRANMRVLHYSPRPLEARSKSYCAFDNMADLPALLQEYGIAT